MPLYHIDLYRLEEATLDDLGLREYLFSEGVAAVEWFERLRGGAEMEYLQSDQLRGANCAGSNSARSTPVTRKLFPS